jgi:tetratricopeptide (TPR) repeat protein
MARIPFWRKVVYALVPVLVFFALLEGALALFGVRPLARTEDPFVGFVSRYPLFEEARAADGTAVLVTAPNKRAHFNLQEFAKAKPANVHRIFCLGGSTTFGRPYSHETSFCGWLEVLLPVADPSRQWEVVNAGGISYASYRVAAVMEELAGLDPDLFIVYTGHNEFLEERTYRGLRESSPLLQRLRSVAYEMRTYTVMTRLWRGGATAADAGEGRDVLPIEVEARLDTSVGPSDYTRDDALRERVALHFRATLSRMVGLADDAGARIVFVTPAANRKDCSPFKSEHRETLGEEDRGRFEASYRRGRDRLGGGDPAAALAAFDDALAIDDRFAELHYRRGHALLALGRNAEAEASFEAALREDICPLRALPRIQSIVRESAAEEGVLLVDFDTMIRTETRRRVGHSAAGSELFFDHVHPTIEAQRLLALALIDALGEAGVVRLHAGWSDAAIESVVQRVEAGLDREAHAEALLRLSKVMHWAGKDEDARRLLLRAREVVPDNPELRYEEASFAKDAGRVDEALRIYRELAAAHPSNGRLHLEIALTLAEMSKPVPSLAHALMAAYLRPDLGTARRVIGLMLASRGRHREAIPHLSEAVRLNPNDADAKRDLERTRRAVAGGPIESETARLHAKRRANGVPELVAEVERDPSGKWVRHGLATKWSKRARPLELAIYEHGVRRERIRIAR